MGKLFRLKEWLTVAEAARHLSTIFREEVTEADVLRLALDRHLTLSVHFVNHATARRGRILAIEDAQAWEVPGDLGARLKLKSPDPTKPITMLEGIYIGDERVLELEPGIVKLDGVYDLPMIGGEKLDVEHRFQKLTDGPSVTLSNLEGAFVQEDELTLYQLQDSFDDNEYQRGSRAELDRLKARIAIERVDSGEADRLLKRHADDRKEFLARRKARPPHEGYYPAAGLPDDLALVVRTSALRELQDKVESTSDDRKKLGARAETTYQNIVGGLLQLMLGHSPSGKAHSVFKDQAAVIEALLAAHGGKPGMSQRTLEERFAAGKRSLGGT